MKYCETCHAAYPNDFQVCPRDNAPLRATSEILEGLVLANKYCILEKIGSGGMATVFKARHLAFNEVRAIKVVNSRHTDDAFIKRFKTEAVISRKLQHPHAVRVDDLDVTEDGRPFIVMEYVEGRSLRKVLRGSGFLAVARSMNIAAQVAEALIAAHALGITHRDIKPDNILLTQVDRTPDFVKVLDFGIAKVKEGAFEVGPDYTPTQSGMVVGTPAYISPEQARGRMGAELDGRADLYSLGVVLYEMVTGQLPFESESSMDMILHHLHTPPVPAHKVRPDLKVPIGISMLLMKAMEKDRESRFQSAEEMLAALRDPAEWAAQGRFSTSAAKMFTSPDPSSQIDDVRATGLRGSQDYEAAAAARVVAKSAVPEDVQSTVEIRPPAPTVQPRAQERTQPIPLAPGTSKMAKHKPDRVRTLLVMVVLVLVGVNAGLVYKYTDYLSVAEARSKNAVATLRMKYSALRARHIVAAAGATGVTTSAPQPTQQSLPQAAALLTDNAAKTSTASTSSLKPVSATGSKAVPRSPSTNAAGNSIPRAATTGPATASALSPGTGELHGIVFGDGHRPAADITLELQNDALGYDQTIASDSSGGFEFNNVPAGRSYTLTAFKDGEAQDTRKGLTIHARGRVSVQPPLRVETQSAPDLNVRVYGRVLDTANAPLNGASIKLENQSLGVLRGAVTDARGDYSFTEVPPGKGYKLSVIHNGNLLLVEDNIQVDPANVNPDQVLIVTLKR